MTNFFAGIEPVKYEGPESKSPLAFRYYNKDQVVLGKRMEDHMRFAIAYWHSFAWGGGDPFGNGTFARPWFNGSDELGLAKLKAEADVDIVGLVLSVDRMEKTKDSDLSAVAAVEKEFGFPVLAIANVREIFEAGRNIVTADGQPYVTDAIKSAADDYLERYGA